MFRLVNFITKSSFSFFDLNMLHSISYFCLSAERSWLVPVGGHMWGREIWGRQRWALPNALCLCVQMLSAVDTEEFLSSLLGEEEDGLSVPCVSHSPLGSDSGISEDTTPPHCPSPHSETDTAPSPVSTEPSPLYVMESFEAQVVQTDHCYSMQQDVYSLQTVRTEKPDSDVFIDFGESGRGLGRLEEVNSWTWEYFSPQS